MGLSTSIANLTTQKGKIAADPLRCVVDKRPPQTGFTRFIGTNPIWANKLNEPARLEGAALAFSARDLSGEDKKKAGQGPASMSKKWHG